MPFQKVIYPGAVTAGGTISIGAEGPEMDKLLSFILKRKNTLTWSGSTSVDSFGTLDVTAGVSGSDDVGEAVSKTVVTGTPTTGEVAQVDGYTIQVGDPINDGDLVIVTYTIKGEVLRA